MTRSLKLIFSSLAFVIFFSCLSFFACAQDKLPAPAQDNADDGFDIRNSSFFLPQPHIKGKYFQNVSLQYVVVPKDWTTQDITAPMLAYSGKYTLPYGFDLQASLATLFISYRTTLGPFWNYSADHFHFGAGWQVVFNYGFLNQFGLNTVISGWEQQPSLIAGYSFKKMALTLRGDLSWINSIYEKQGGHTVPYTTSFLNGYTLMVTLEQRLWKNRLMSFGVKLDNLRFHIIAWPAYPVNQYRYWFPEFHLGLSF
ncbi:MAG: hypothetical protein ACHQEM_03985 [Chitinophagales bacterium]